MGYFSKVAEEVFPFPHYFVRRRKLLRQAGSAEILNGTKQFAGYGSLSEELISSRLQEERQRASAMDEKTFKMTLSLSIGLTIIGSVAALFINNISWLPAQVALTVAIGVGLFYVLAGGFVALGALRTLPSYGYGTQVLLEEGGARQQLLAESLARQETVNLIRHLRNETAYQSLRNGLLLLFVAILLFAAALARELMTSPVVK